MDGSQLGSDATGCRRVNTDDTTLTERVEPSSFGAAGDRLLVHLSISKITACPGDTRINTKRFDVLAEEPEQGEIRKKESEKLEFEAWLGFRNFRIFRMNFRSEVPSCASRPIEAMVWVNEMESVKLPI